MPIHPDGVDGAIAGVRPIRAPALDDSGTDVLVVPSHGSPVLGPVLGAVVITGAPGAGKSATIEALSGLLAKRGIEHSALETEQLAWGQPWLPLLDTLAQLKSVLRIQRQLGRRAFLLTATTETEEELDALVLAIGGLPLVVALTAPPGVVSARVLQREPEHWEGRHGLAAKAAALTRTIPRLRRVDIVLDTSAQEPHDVAEAIYRAMTHAEGASG